MVKGLKNRKEFLFPKSPGLNSLLAQFFSFSRPSLPEAGPPSDPTPQHDSLIPVRTHIGDPGEAPGHNRVNPVVPDVPGR
jgi:hypothetical protein